VITKLDERLMHGEVPESLRGILLDHPWELLKLLALDLTVTELSVDSLVWQLDLPWWRLGADWFAVTPNEVRRDPSGFHEQWVRAIQSDLEAPIHVRMTEWGPVILDGVHRLLKAAVEGRSSLPARVLPDESLPCIYKDVAASDPQL
jgi:hypothetical protein